MEGKTMKMSAKSRYGMLGFTDVLQNGTVSVNDVAKKHNISKKFLEVSFNQMKKSGILVSKSGNNGGYRLAKDASEISLYDVFSCLEGDVNIAEPDFDNSKVKDFIFENVWDKINENIKENLKNIAVKDVF